MLTELIAAECLTEPFNLKSKRQQPARNLETNKTDTVAIVIASNFIQIARSKFAGCRQLPVSLGDGAGKDGQRPR